MYTLEKRLYYVYFAMVHICVVKSESEEVSKRRSRSLKWT
jgi:hypothetical protein